MSKFLNSIAAFLAGILGISCAISLYITSIVTPIDAKDQIIAASIQIDDYCSGTVIQSDDKDDDGIYTTKVLTAKHCFRTVGGYLTIGTVIPVHHFVYTDNYRQSDIPFAMKIEKYSDGDLALLEMESEVQLPSISIATKEVQESLEFGEQVFNVSFPGMLEQFYNEGFLGHLEHVQNGAIPDGDYQLADITIMPGSSGSSLVVTRWGTPYVIGVLTSGYFGQGSIEGYITDWTCAESIINFVGG